MSEQNELMQVLIQLKKRLNQFHEILDLTQQMEKALAHDDSVSFKILLAMRQESIHKADDQEREVKELIRTISPENRKIVQNKMNQEASLEVAEGSFEEKQLETVCSQIKRLIGRVLDIDCIINRKVAGTKSIYDNRKVFR